VSTTAQCPFCERAAAGGAEFGNVHALAFPDGFPVSPGHTLVIPRRHCEGLFDLSADEYAAVWQLAREVREALHERLRPDGFNVGANDGWAAGQTVQHAHVHVIPRFYGDVADPRGGIRWVMPDRAAYWQEPDS
jgi:diadenosine tetraphosphate (Ap4A) HIT family hydrolase